MTVEIPVKVNLIMGKNEVSTAIARGAGGGAGSPSAALTQATGLNAGKMTGAVAAGVTIAGAIMEVSNKIGDFINEYIMGNQIIQQQLKLISTLITILFQPVAYVIGTMLKAVIPPLLLMVKMVNLMFRPFMMQLVTQVKKINDTSLSPIGKMLAISYASLQTLEDFGKTLFGSLIKDLIKTIIDSGVKITQVLITVIGGGIISLIRMFQLLLTKFGVSPEALEGVAGAATNLFAGAITSLEFYSQTAQLMLDTAFTLFIDNLTKTKDASESNTQTMSGWAEQLGNLGRVFDEDFGNKIQTGIENVATATDTLKGKINEFITAGGTAETVWKTILDYINKVSAGKSPIDAASSATQAFNSAMQQLANDAKKAADKIKNALRETDNKPNKAKDIYDTYIKPAQMGYSLDTKTLIANSDFGKALGFGKSKQVGFGFVPNDGAYYLHRGEQVVSASQLAQADRGLNMNNNITINAKVDSKVDIASLADEIAKELKSRMNRISTYGARW